MRAHTRLTFLLLLGVQAAHSLEEYAFGLYRVFPPARFASRLLSDDPAAGFAALNAALIAFGIWCYLARVRPRHPSAAAWMWPWALIEIGNGVAHPTLALLRGGYFPGVATAPLLLALGLLLARQLWRARARAEEG